MKSIVCFLLVAVSIAIAQTPISTGIARMKGTIADPGINGIVTFTQAGTMVNISVSLQGITSNLGVFHGLHVHEFGDVLLNTGASVGTHWNPYGQPHGCPETSGNTRHLGDTGNWNVSTDGTLTGYKLIDLMSLTGNNSIIGFAVIFHNQTDDCLNITSSGSRLAQGVIGVANPAYYGGATGAQNTALPPNYYPTLTNAICNLQNATGASTITGWVRFSQATASSPTIVTAAISGLTAASIHGFHVHQYGDFTTFDAVSAGNHYTGPIYDATMMHSIPTSGFQKHVGDMGNLYFYGNDGVAYYNNSFTEFGLWGTSNNILGRGVVLHAIADNCSQPLGAAGSRLAICVIGPMNPANANTYVVPAAVGVVPVTQNTAACGTAVTTMSAPVTTNSAPVTTMSAPVTTKAQAASSFASKSAEYSFFVMIAAIVCSMIGNFF